LLRLRLCLCLRLLGLEHCQHPFSFVSDQSGKSTKRIGDALPQMLEFPAAGPRGVAAYLPRPGLASAPDVDALTSASALASTWTSTGRRGVMRATKFSLIEVDPVERRGRITIMVRRSVRF